MDGNERLIEGAAFAALWQVAGHYLPTARPWDRPTVRGRLAAYVWGVSGILLGVGIACGGRVMGSAFGIAAAAGAATVGVYAADHLANEPARKAYHDGFDR